MKEYTIAEYENSKLEEFIKQTNDYETFKSWRSNRNQAIDGPLLFQVTFEDISVPSFLKSHTILPSWELIELVIKTLNAFNKLNLPIKYELEAPNFSKKNNLFTGRIAINDFTPMGLHIASAEVGADNLPPKLHANIRFAVNEPALFNYTLPDGSKFKNMLGFDARFLQGNHPGTLLHEIGHTPGLYHPHTRIGSFGYNPKYQKFGEESFFADPIRSEDNYLTFFDHLSVMGYPFSILTDFAGDAVMKLQQQGYSKEKAIQHAKDIYIYNTYAIGQSIFTQRDYEALSKAAWLIKSEVGQIESKDFPLLALIVDHKVPFSKTILPALRVQLDPVSQWQKIIPYDTKIALSGATSKNGADLRSFVYSDKKLTRCTFIFNEAYPGISFNETGCNLIINNNARTLVDANFTVNYWQAGNPSNASINFQWGLQQNASVPLNQVEDLFPKDPIPPEASPIIPIPKEAQNSKLSSYQWRLSYEYYRPFLIDYSVNGAINGVTSEFFNQINNATPENLQNYLSILKLVAQIGILLHTTPEYLREKLSQQLIAPYFQANGELRIPEDIRSNAAFIDTLYGVDRFDALILPYAVMSITLSIFAVLSKLGIKNTFWLDRLSLAPVLSNIMGSILSNPKVYQDPYELVELITYNGLYMAGSLITSTTLGGVIWASQKTYNFVKSRISTSQSEVIELKTVTSTTEANVAGNETQLNIENWDRISLASNFEQPREPACNKYSFSQAIIKAKNDVFSKKFGDCFSRCFFFKQRKITNADQTSNLNDSPALSC